MIIQMVSISKASDKDDKAELAEDTLVSLHNYVLIAGLVAEAEFEETMDFFRDMPTLCAFFRLAYLIWKVMLLLCPRMLMMVGTG